MVSFDKKHFEIIGKLTHGNRIIREFLIDDIIIEKLKNILFNRGEKYKNVKEVEHKGENTDKDDNTDGENTDGENTNDEHLNKHNNIENKVDQVEDKDKYNYKTKYLDDSSDSGESSDKKINFR